MLKKIGNQFKKPTGFFGWLASCLMVKGNKSAYITLMDDLHIQPNDTILEIGYGPGSGIHLMAKKVGSFIIYGIDFSELMFKRASRRNKEFIENKRVHLFLGDFLETDIHKNGFDKIFCINVVYFWDELQKPFGRIKSLLKEDGLFCFFMAHKDDLSKLKFTSDDIFNKYSIEQIIEALKLAGFRDVNYTFKNGYNIKAKK